MRRWKRLRPAAPAPSPTCWARPERLQRFAALGVTVATEPVDIARLLQEADLCVTHGIGAALAALAGRRSGADAAEQLENFLFAQALQRIGVGHLVQPGTSQARHQGGIDRDAGQSGSTACRTRGLPGGIRTQRLVQSSSRPSPALKRWRRSAGGAHMIGRIAGRLLVKQPPQIIVDVNGVGYEIDVPMSTLLPVARHRGTGDAVYPPRRARGCAPAVRLRHRGRARTVPAS